LNYKLTLKYEPTRTKKQNCKKHQSIQQNKLLLAEIYEMLNTDLALNKNKHQLPKGEKEDFERGLKDFEEGKVLTDEAIRKPYAKYFIEVD